MHYTPHIDYAFASVEHIMTDVNYAVVAPAVYVPLDRQLRATFELETCAALSSFDQV